MDELNQYLQGAFVTDLELLRKVRTNADAALDTLARFKQNSQFPYELCEGEVWRTNSSHSTAAMIYFAMAVAVGRISSSALVPSVTSRNQDEMPDEIRSIHRRVSGTLASDVGALLSSIEAERLEAEQKASEKNPESFHVCFSSTYGPDDPFTLVWLLELLWALKDSTELAQQYRAVFKTATERVRRVFDSADPARKALTTEHNLEHLFPVLRVVQLYTQLCRDPEYNKPTYSALAHYLQNRLHLHLSYFDIRDSSYDAAELAFAMEAILLLDANGLDAATVDRCLHVLLESQQRNPYWRPLRPFIATSKGMILLPLSVEIANSLIRSCEILDKRDQSQEYVSRYVELFRRYTEWLFTRIVRGVTANQERFVGWHSEHADDPGKIHLWETSQVLLYLLHYESLLRKHRAHTALRLMNLNISSAVKTDKTPIERWMDQDDNKAPLRREPLPNLDPKSDYRIYSRIAEWYIRPRSPERDANVKPHYSMLLFGPQGTGKTTLAEDIARCLGQPLISISPSDFTVGGGALVEARAKAIFDVLTAQTDVVILLDEIDRLILDRDSKMYRKHGDLFQFMTPGMLTKFRNLRRTQRSIFIVSTNYAEKIDAAIKRVGRIDDQFILLPPDRKQRFQIIDSELKDHLPAAERPNEEEMDSVLSRTALFIPGELQLAVKRAVELLSAVTKSELIGALTRQIENVEPTIRLTSYQPRFRWGHDEGEKADFEANQEPYAEFLLLVYLILESGRDFSPEESELLSRFSAELPTDPDELRRKLTFWIKDQSVVDLLYSGFAAARK